MAELSQGSWRAMIPFALGLVATALVGCQGLEEPVSPTPSASQTQSSSPVASTGATASVSPTTEDADQRDLRLAGEAVVEYWAEVDQLAASPDSSIDDLKTVAADQAFAQQRVAVDAYRAKGWTQVGTASVTSVRATAGKGANFTVSACVDVSEIDFLDEEGESQVNPDRPDSQRFSYTVEKRNTKFLVVRDTLKGTPC
ncbi:MAG: DUF4101 domain-containing protein [Micrococcales bacterium]|nr:DUF4101 domain-containing protein [Micrococcales bacterium]